MINADMASQHALDHMAKCGFASISPLDQDLAVIWLWVGQVSNSGFRHYYSTKAGDLAFHAPEAFRHIGAIKTARIAELANAVFSPDGPPGNLPAREERMKAFGQLEWGRFDALEKEFSEIEEDTDALLDMYLNQPQPGTPE